MINHVIGEKFTAAHWAARSDTLPAEILGGKWIFCGHEYNSRSSQPPAVKSRGMEPIEHDPITGRLPEQIEEGSQDVCLINMPGSEYYKNPAFRQGLWNCSFSALRPDGLLISTQAIQAMTPDLEGAGLIEWCQQRFKEITLTGLKGIGIMNCFTLRVSPNHLSEASYPSLEEYSVGLYKKNATLSLPPKA